MWYVKKWRYALDSKHGFGILMTGDESADKSPCFFEDNTLETVEKDDVERESAVSNLLEDYNYREYRFNSRVKHLADSMAAARRHRIAWT